MSNTVKFDVQGFGKTVDIMDTNANVKLVNARLAKMYEALNKVDEEKGENALMTDYFSALQEQLMLGVKEILGLSATDAKKLDDTSFSDLEKFYDEVVDKFTAIPMPTVKKMVETNKAILDAQVQNETSEDEGNVEDPK